MKTIEEYNGCHYFLFMAHDKGDFVNLIITAYNETMILKAFEEDVFGGDGVTYTLVEK